jgi:hypothetical protein
LVAIFTTQAQQKTSDAHSAASDAPTPACPKQNERAANAALFADKTAFTARRIRHCPDYFASVIEATSRRQSAASLKWKRSVLVIDSH